MKHIRMAIVVLAIAGCTSDDNRPDTISSESFGLDVAVPDSLLQNRFPRALQGQVQAKISVFGIDGQGLEVLQDQTETGERVRFTPPDQGGFVIDVEWRDLVNNLLVATFTRAYEDIGFGEFTVSNDQYVTSYDDDGDGVFNLTELNQGSDMIDPFSPGNGDSCGLVDVGSIDQFFTEFSETNCALDFNGDIDSFFFTVNMETSLILEHIGDSGFDTIGRLFNDSGSQIAVDDDSGNGLQFSIVTGPLQPGNYTLQVHSFRSEAGNYDLGIFPVRAINSKQHRE